ncbi:MAG: radical SAM protein [Candidatus Omnitrophica bacterium]|nr:radical SAM protein [Candidatus Omnitrophota bacterium]
MERPVRPIEIIIEITGKCRLACPYCTRQSRKEVPLKDIKATLDEAASLGIKVIRITGGEPLLHPDIQTILAYAKMKKFAVILNTAAEDISPALMKAIITNVDAVLVSLQGHNEKSHRAYTRSKLSFLNKIKNIFLLKAYVPNVWIATVITPGVLQCFTQFIPLIKKINPAAWILLRPINGLNRDIKKMGIPFYRALTLKIMKARQRNINTFIANPIPLCIAGDLRIGLEAFFGAKFDNGHVRIVRSSQGFYKPSYFLETNLGNSIKTAWDHPFLRELDRTDFLPNLCQQCPVLDTCRGGYRSMPPHTRQTALAEDPLFCPVIAQKALSKPYLKHPRP